MVINTIKGQFEIEYYEDKRAIPIANLVETTWLSRYCREIEIMHDQGKECIGDEFKK